MIGNYILSGRVQAIIATTALTLLFSLIVLPFSFLLSGAIIGLIVLRKGSIIGLQVLIISSVLLQFFSMFSGLSIQLGLVYALVIWLPVWIAAMVLRETERQGLSIVVVTLLAIVLVVAVYVSIGDVAAWWRQWLELMLKVAIPPAQIVQYRSHLEMVIPVMNAMMIAGAMLNVIMALLYARWWQSRLFNPGGFQKEFYLLRLPPVVLVISAIIVPFPFVSAEPWQPMFRDILIMMLFMYLIQGLSAVHRNINRLQLSIIWLILIYCLLILWSPMGLFIACLGVIDVYILWRREKIGYNNNKL